MENTAPAGPLPNSPMDAKPRIGIRALPEFFRCEGIDAIDEVARTPVPA